MNINNLIERLNNELEKLNNLKKESIDTNTFFTNADSFNDDFIPKTKTDLNSNDEHSNNCSISVNSYAEIKPNSQTTSLVTVKETRLLAVQNMFKKSIHISLKSFLISISISFLNLFI